MNDYWKQRFAESQNTLSNKNIKQIEKQLRIYYGTQQATKPPTFVLFVNDKELLHFSYERYLENQFRKAFGFDGTPIRFVLREREQKEE